MCDYKLYELETLFFIDIARTDISSNYSTYSDLLNLNSLELWRHATNFGYKEQRRIFYDSCYNDAFYCNYLNTYRTQVLSIDPYFNWETYIKINNLHSDSEYYALIDFIYRQKLEKSISSPSSDTITISGTQSQYTIICEQSSYKKDNYLFHYGSGQSSTEKFGMIIPFKSKLLRGYFMYHYDDAELRFII